MDTKEEIIIQAAMLNFSRFGFKKTSVDDIAKDAGVGKGTIYNYFKSKEELLFKVTEVQKAKANERIRAKINTKESASDKLKAYFETALQFFHEEKREFQFTPDNFKELFEVHSTVHGENNPPKNTIEPILEILKHGNDSGEFSIEDIHKTGMIIWKVFHRSAISWITQQEEEALREVKDFVHLFLNGLKAR